MRNDAGRIAELRAQGLSLRAISERTGIPRSTVADRVARTRDVVPIRILGRDGRRYLAVRDPRLDEPVLGPSSVEATGQDAATLADRELRRLLLLGQLRQVRDLVPDIVPLTEPSTTASASRSTWLRSPASRRCGKRT